MELPFYRQRWFETAWPVVVALTLYVILHWNQPAETPAGWLVDGLGAAMMFLITLALASQYVLPVRKWSERKTALSRLFLYVMGGHGPIVFVQDGQMIADEAELKRRGAGVILLDSSSAVVLERGRRFSRACGPPGIVFVEPGERFLMPLDLRKQVRFQNAKALTKDGIEVNADVSVTFGLDPGDQTALSETADERSFFGPTHILPAFPFNPESAFKAVYGGAVTEKDPLTWLDLPLIVATEFFRDQVNRFTLDELFLDKEEEPKAKEQETKKRDNGPDAKSKAELPKSSPVRTLQIQLTGRVQSAALLRDRGIKVYSVSVGVLNLPDEVMKQRISSWAARWQVKMKEVMADANAATERLMEVARADAKYELAREFKELLATTFSPGGAIPTDQELARLCVKKLDSLASDSMTRMMMQGHTINQIATLRQFVGLESEKPKDAKIIGDDAPAAGSEAEKGDGDSGGAAEEAKAQ